MSGTTEGSLAARATHHRHSQTEAPDMRSPGPGWTVLCTSWALVAILAAPLPAAAQCAMMGSGGHDHSAMHDRSARGHSSSQKKLQQGIDRLLSDDEGRAMLVDALLNDRAFVESFIQRLATIPELRSMVVGQLAPGPARDSLGAARQESSSATAALYVCPMHPDVTSSKPGDCPRCGMQLVRSAPDRK